MNVIRCRAALGDVECLNGKPTATEFGEDLPMTEDGTYDSETDTMVCTPCYERLAPWTLSGRALLEELPEAIAIYRQQLAYVRQHDNPRALAQEAEIQADGRSGAFQASAMAARAMALRELRRREAG